MSLLSTVIGFSAFGFGARCFQLGLQKRPIFTKPEGHLLAATAFGAFGYYAYGLNERQTALIAEKKAALEAHRAAEAAAAA